MSLKRNLIVAAGLAALCLPMAASAQVWGGYGGQWTWQGGQDNAWRGADPDAWRASDRRDWRGGDDDDRRGGDYYGDARSWFQGFPEFQGVRTHLKQEIREGLEEGWLSQDRAQRIVNRYKDIERDEYREFTEHGWNLPDREREAFRDRLSELDRRLDQAREGGY